ncbi:hypothetical protein GGQ85_002216 [Nitrobacter vulgaris]|uniref:Alb1 domain-containing protein n=1 Tax=Nitrobacter vulgaris TaxID=29421 RepID=UPI002864F7D3|nr:Alb1 domain-containing protein [Nitrobacter vulgaris]MDR6304506.1 hypothetical protein [Nitrobacter vulgaris]
MNFGVHSRAAMNRTDLVIEYERMLSHLAKFWVTPRTRTSVLISSPHVEGSLNKLIVAMEVGAAALFSVSAANAANQKDLTDVAQYQPAANLNIGTIDTFMGVSTMATAMIGIMANLAIV